MIMNTALLLLGITITIFGIIITYLLVVSVFKMGQSMIEMQTQTESLIQTQMNGIVSTTLIGGALILIGILVVREAFRR